MSFDNDLGLRNKFKDKDIAHNFAYFDVTSTPEFVSSNFTGPTNVIPADLLATDGDPVDVSGAGPPTAGEVLTALGPTAAAWAAAPAATTVRVFLDGQVTGTNGGGFASGAWRTRTLNITVGNLPGSLIGNSMFMSTGNYWVRAAAPAYIVDEHQLRLFNGTDAVVEITGICAEADPNLTPALAGHSLAVLEGFVTVVGFKGFVLQHQCTMSRAADGFGLAAGFAGTPEVYSMVTWIRLS